LQRQYEEHADVISEREKALRGMAYRDRTGLFLSYRQSSVRQASVQFKGLKEDEETSGLIGHDAVIEMDRLPPRWHDTAETVNSILAKIESEGQKLASLHQKHVLPGFNDRRREEDEIEQLTSQITRQFHECQRLIGEIEKQSATLDSQADMTMNKNIQISLAIKVQQKSRDFRKKQSAYLKRMLFDYPKAKAELRGSSSPYERPTTPSLQDDDWDVSYSQSALQVTATSNDATIRRREQEITDIARGIIEVADIFKELQTLVIDQGTMLDRIDYNIERMSTHVKSAAEELTQVMKMSALTNRRLAVTKRTRKREKSYSCYYLLLWDSSLFC